jgi:hypothetical protein
MNRIEQILKRQPRLALFFILAIFGNLIRFRYTSSLTKTMKLLYLILQEIKNMTYKIYVQFAHIPAVVNYDVPYVCQFATIESSELSLAKGLSPADDPHRSTRIYEDIGPLLPIKKEVIW